MSVAKRSVVIGVVIVLSCVVVAIGTWTLFFSENGSAPSVEPAMGNDADVSTEALDSILEGVSAQNTETIKGLVESIWFFPEDYGISYQCFSQEYFGGFSYSLDTPRLVDENTALIDLTVSTRPQDQVLSSLEQAREAAADAGVDMAKDGYADGYLTSSLQQSPWKTKSITMSVELVKDDEGEWAIKDERTLASVLLDGINPRQDAS